MLFKCAKGMYWLQKNYRDSFNLEAFMEKYIEECFDRCSFIVGDISSGILRLKGFNNDDKSPNYYGNINNYLETTCIFGAPYYILKRINSEGEYEHLSKNPKTKQPDTEGVTITPITKENFDKESLILHTSKKVSPKINIDPIKMNAIPKGKAPADIKDDDVKPNNNSNAKKQEPEPVVDTQTYVSASPDFDPSKKQEFKRNNNNNNNKNKNHHKNKNKNHNNNNKNNNDSKR